MLLFGACTTGAASASSLVHVAPPAEGSSRSVVTLGAAVPGEAGDRSAASEPSVSHPVSSDAGKPMAENQPMPSSAVALSPSILAFEPPVPAVTFEKVAAVPAPLPPQAQPIVIRGGLVDGIPGATTEPVTLPDETAPR
jgi:hypothetical protein